MSRNPTRSQSGVGGMTDPRKIDEPEFRDLCQRFTRIQIAEFKDVSRGTVTKWAERFNVEPLRKCGTCKRIGPVHEFAGWKTCKGCAGKPRVQVSTKPRKPASTTQAIWPTEPDEGIDCQKSLRNGTTQYVCSRPFLCGCLSCPI